LVEDGKTLALDGFLAMLNIGPLWREGVPLFCIEIVLHIETFPMVQKSP
jgi:hypothetical protein